MGRFIRAIQTRNLWATKFFSSRATRPGKLRAGEEVIEVGERYIIFKGEDMPAELDEDVGLVIVVHSDQPQNHDERGWMSRSQARLLASELGYALEIDGPSDEELKQLKHDGEPGDDEVPF